MTFIIINILTILSVISLVLGDTINCDTFNPKRIKLVTFDVFAALMDLTSSLNKNIASILPDLTQSEVQSFTEQWESGYGSYAGFVFDESISGEYPFQYVAKTTLDEILESNKYNITSDQYSQLILSWGQLIPWTNTKAALQSVYSANYHIGTLSNGDEQTLTTAMSIFSPDVKFSYYFSSDFPNAGSFKPDSRMYHQLSALSNYTVEEILHVAGAPIDGWGARAAGLYSALVSPVPYPKKPLPCFLLKDISEVPSILGL